MIELLRLRCSLCHFKVSLPRVGAAGLAVEHNRACHPLGRRTDIRAIITDIFTMLREKRLMTK